MNDFNRRRIGLFLMLGVLSGPALSAEPPAGEVLTLPGGETVSGGLAPGPDGELLFVSAVDGRAIPLTTGASVRFPVTGSIPGAGPAAFRVELGIGERLSGRLEGLNERELIIQGVAGGGRTVVARGGLGAISQRPGEAIVLQDGFESLDGDRWIAVGIPTLIDAPRLAGERSLKLAAGANALAHRVVNPFEAGRFDMAFHDGGASAADQTWFVDLTFRSPNGLETVRTVLGWTDASLAVESPDGPALAVQRLARGPGWHRLAVDFAPGRLAISVDGDELAHGKGAQGPLVELKLGTESAGKALPPDGLAAVIDDLRLVRFEKPPIDLETDATQDEVRLTNGDQIFGRVSAASAEEIEASVDAAAVRLPWSEVAAIAFKRTAAAGLPVSGTLVRVEWRADPRGEERGLDAIEGALVRATDESITLATPFCGELTIPRPLLTGLRVLGKGSRLVIDNKAHHLGDEVSVMPPVLDPPQPEGGTLERSFELPKRNAGVIELVVDVVQVAGEASDLPFAMLVKKGELRTNVSINGVPFDYLNRHVSTRNDAPERLRLPIPREHLRPGTNVVRFEQVGIANDPNYLDDLGVLGIAVEITER